MSDDRVRYRLEEDSMGTMRVPADGLYGASTKRAVLNFPVSGHRMPVAFIRSLGRVKGACARANLEMERLDERRAGLILRAAKEIVDGSFDEQFPVDVFQTGSGTSTNMNANEVIANRCSQLAGEVIGSRNPVHPNDHANLSQSSNDVIPTALHVSVALELTRELIPSLEALSLELKARAEDWSDVIKVGRTHTMDATPVTMGQVFGGYARQMEKAVKRIREATNGLLELAVGGTAVGTGLNAPAGFGARVCALLADETGLEFREAQDHFEAQAARDDSVAVAGVLAAAAAALGKIASDIRMMGSGPRAGLGELKLPATQPGSSIMPGKVNPVMCEMMIQVSHYVHGLAQTVTRCGQDGQFELNVTIPLIAYSLHESVGCLSRAVGLFNRRCVAGLEAEGERCRAMADGSLMLVTALNPIIGYDRAAEAVKKAHDEGTTLVEAVVDLGLMDETTARAALDPVRMLGGSE